MSRGWRAGWTRRVAVTVAGAMAAVGGAVSLFPSPALGAPAEPAGAVGGTATGAADEAEPWFGKLEFRSIGPAIGGRVSRVAGVAGDPLTWYAATAQGGVWKSEDGGRSFRPIFDDQPASSLGAIAVAPSDPNVVYVGAGEANIRGNVAAGNGIYKSTDAGKSWRQVWKSIGQIGTMAVHPTDPDVAFAAVLGSAFGPGPQRGVFRTEDGGISWRRVLFVDEQTGASDVAFDPANPRRLFAGTWQARRQPWGMTSGGPGGGLWFSGDGGESWTRVEHEGLPQPPWGKVGVQVAPSDSRRVYALIEAEEGGLFRSDDGGESWRRVNAHRALRQRAWYYSVLTIDPRNPDVVWFPQVHLLKTIDGGSTITSVPGLSHADHHDVWIDPAEPRRMISGHDGGVDLSVDGGKSWWAPKLPLAQFYNLDVDDREPYHVGGTIQDQGTASGPSNSLKAGGIALSEWTYVGGGEAGDFVYDERQPGVVYAGEYGGYLSHFDERTSQARMIGIYPTNPSGRAPSELRHRFQWTAPLATSPHDPRVLYHGGERLFRTLDRGESWSAISPDLTRNDRSKQQWSGGPITGDNTGVEVYGTIFSVAESPLAAGTIWAGTDDGRVHVTRDGGASWSEVTPPGMPEWGTVEGLELSRRAEGTAYVVVDAHRLDDYRPHLFRTRDGGRSWESLAKGLPQDVHLFAVREDPERPGLLFLGHEQGVSMSRDDGRSWQRLKLNLPTVAVVDLEVRHGDLILATRGRSIWILDDLTPLREWSDEVAARPLHLFAPRPAVRWRLGWSWGQAHEGLGANPPYGAVLSYHLAKAPEGPVILEVLDADGALVRRLDSAVPPVIQAEDDPDEPTPAPKAALQATAGLHRAVWDLRYEGARRLERAKIDLGSPHAGPLAPPGRYTLRLKVGEAVAETTVEVRPDRRSPVPVAEMRAAFDRMRELRDTISRVVDRIEEIRWLQPQLLDLARRLEGDAAAAELVELARRSAASLDELERELHNPDAEVVYDILSRGGGARIHSILTLVYDWGMDGSDHAPTQGMREVVAEETAKLEAVEARLAALRARELARVEELARQGGLPRILPPPAPPAR